MNAALTDLADRSVLARLEFPPPSRVNHFVRHSCLRAFGPGMSTSTPKRQYSVESYNTDPTGRPQQSGFQVVWAASPEAAAMQVLNEELFTIGSIERLRARVKHLSDDGLETVTTLYSKL